MSGRAVSAVRIRMYNVGFGDCFLLRFETDARPYTMLIDCGRLSGSAKSGPDFWTVVRSMISALPLVEGRSRIDVVVMTHRHRDHVHGFSDRSAWAGVEVGEVWMPWTENPEDPTAVGLHDSQDRAARLALGALAAFGVSEGIAHEVALNSITNGSAMETLRTLSSTPVQYLPDKNASTATTRTRSTTVARDVLPDDVTIRVLGPSHDPQVIRRLKPPSGQSYVRLATTGDPVTADTRAVPSPWGGQWDRARPTLVESFACALDLKPERFEKLLADVRFGSRSDAEQLAFDVDNALNGTSLVLCIEVGPHMLLFPGDAQWGTWKVMLETEAWQQYLQRTTFLKVGHHGSHNATPTSFVNGGYMRGATAMVSVAPTSYTSEGWKAIPKADLLAALTETGGVDQLVRSDAPLPAVVTGIARAVDDFYTELTLPMGES